MLTLYITFISKSLSNVINYFQVYHIYNDNKVNPVHHKVKLNRHKLPVNYRLHALQQFIGTSYVLCATRRMLLREGSKFMLTQHVPHTSCIVHRM